MHILWNEIIGFIFICFALIPLPKIYKFYYEFQATGERLPQLITSIFFFLIMLSFGIGSFRRAKKISRS